MDSRRWRLHWVAAIGILRAVGHVPNNMDGKISSDENRGACRLCTLDWQRAFSSASLLGVMHAIDKYAVCFMYEDPPGSGTEKFYRSLSKR